MENLIKSHAHRFIVVLVVVCLGLAYSSWKLQERVGTLIHECQVTLQDIKSPAK